MSDELHQSTWIVPVSKPEIMWLVHVVRPPFYPPVQTHLCLIAWRPLAWFLPVGKVGVDCISDWFDARVIGCVLDCHLAFYMTPVNSWFFTKICLSVNSLKPWGIGIGFVRLWWYVHWTLLWLEPLLSRIVRHLSLVGLNREVALFASASFCWMVSRAVVEVVGCAQPRQLPHPFNFCEFWIHRRVSRGLQAGLAIVFLDNMHLCFIKSVICFTGISG